MSCHNLFDLEQSHDNQLLLMLEFDNATKTHVQENRDTIQLDFLYFHYLLQKLLAQFHLLGLSLAQENLLFLL